ncbi:MAG: Gfo/Idh/MocA family oxidoreductase [Planctomycetes bacterium]|nr:Gfo/Idh/MocA family oxidoreductase [Planctomycetota bacterium]
MYRGILTGLGGRGLYWLNDARAHPECEIVACVEPVEANRERAIAKHKVPAETIFPTLDAAVKAVKADFVLDVTPPAVHHEIALKAFKAGLHVLGEKPLSDNPANAKRVVAAARKAKLRHMITQNYRFNPVIRTMHKQLAAGLIGKPGQCDLRFYMDWADIPGSHYVTQPFMLINDMMVHHFDLMRYVLGADPVAVTAVTWNHPWGWHKGDAAHSIVFEFPGGLWGTHVSVGCAVGERTDYNGDWRIEGPKGTLSYSLGRLSHGHFHGATKPVRQEIFPEAAPSGGAGILAEFFAAIKEKRQPECSGEDNLKSLAMVFGAIKSSKEGRRVKI